QTASSPIASLNYFAAVIDEVIEQSNTSETYWAYIRRQMMTLERQWVTCIRRQDQLVGGLIPRLPFRRGPLTGTVAHITGTVANFTRNTGPVTGIRLTKQDDGNEMMETR